MKRPALVASTDHLHRHSEGANVRRACSHFDDILIIEDETFDADRIKATLHIMFGYEITIRHAASLDRAIDCVIERKPQVVLLDDVLPPNENAVQTIAFLRKAGYDGPIVIVSDRASRLRSAQLLAVGAVDAIHKDNLDTVRLGEALARARGLQEPQSA